MLPRSRKFLILLSLLCLLGILGFEPVRGFEFLNYDDEGYVTGNSQVLRGLRFEGLMWAFTTGHMSNWHPVTWLAHMTISHFFGALPAAHHLANVFFHLLGAGLLFTFLFGTTGALYRSFFVAAFFLIHPLRAASVAWVSELKDVLTAFFWMLALVFYWRYTAAARLRTFFYTACFAAFCLGLMSKPMIVTLPFILLLVDYWPLGRLNSFRDLSARSIEKLPFLLPLAAALVLTLWAQGSGGAIRSLEETSLAFRLSNASVVYLKYLRKILWPGDLAVFYPLAAHIPIWKSLGALLFLILMSFLALWKGRKFPYLPVGWFWYLGSLVPVIGLVQVGIQEMGDRYTYVPSVGFLILVFWGCGDLMRRRGASDKAKLCAWILLGFALIGTRHELRHWKDSVSVWSRALEVTPKNYKALVQLGNAYLERGQFPEAEKYLEAAMDLYQRDWNGLNSMGLILMHQKQYHRAISYYRKALRLNPDYPAAHFNLGTAYLQLDQPELGRDHLQRSVKLNPSLVEAHLGLSESYLDQCRVEEAQTHLSKAGVLNSKPAQKLQERIANLQGKTLAEKMQNCEEGLRSLVKGT